MAYNWQEGIAISWIAAENAAEWTLDSHGAGRLIMYSLVDRNPRFPSERPYSRHRPLRHTSMVSAPVQAEHLVSLVHKSPTARAASICISLAYVLHFTRPDIIATEDWALLRSIRDKRCYIASARWGQPRRKYL